MSYVSLEAVEEEGDMKAVFGLLLIVLRVCHAVETSCDARQDGAQCYGAVGGTVEIRLMDSTTGIHRFIWKKNTLRILRGQETKIVSNQYKNRSIFILNNGTFRISNLNRNDTGTYELELINSSGIIIERRTQILSIQAPVSSVQLDSECLSQGGRRASCSSDGGDSPHYSWTLDGHTLKDSQLLYGNQTSNNIILREDVSGQLVCSVSNHVSSVSKGERISTCVFINCTFSSGTQISQWLPEEIESLCFEPTTPPDSTVAKESDSTNSSNTTSIKPNNDSSLLACILKAVVITLLLLGMAVFFGWRKWNDKKAEASTTTRRTQYQESSFSMAEVRSSASQP
ncbi:uncharacterized protein LOC115427673 [Sphaeramia orbicularis]|uniref:uncharacterized protein LOC115427673 n=1 Tax=Sphaeramia orbicularis TaxID=375764 RepID=UPI00117C5BCC|nr:uncharacterized protein LOC115427673 [Sphaeramia orbicularis]